MRRVSLAAFMALYFCFGITSIAMANASGNGTNASPAGVALPDSPTASILQLSTATDEKTATVTGTFNLPPLKGAGLNGGAQAWYLSVSAQTPVGQGSDYTNISTLDGLTKATSIKFQFTYLTGGFEPGSGGPAFESEAAQQECLRLVKLAQGSVSGNELCVRADIDSALSHMTDLDHKYQDDLEVAADDKKAKILAQLDENAAIEQAVRENLKKYDDIVSAKPAALLMMSLNGKIGYEQHVYYDPSTLAKSTLDKTPFQIGAEGTYIFGKGAAAINVSFNFQRAFKDANNGVAQTACKTASTPVLPCVTGFIGAPKESDKELLEADLRYVSTLPVLDVPIGIDPGVTYDARGHSEAVQVPVYIFTDSSKNLAGGIRYDWTSNNHTSVVGLFVSAAFSVFAQSP